ncbi:hypothetical protein D2917_17625 [Cupriavidus oxalaticus]|uniref:Uncharacterized protein n=1 Tax=Cupriavidus oxalaticus TaxID=96344 RepID=A0A5P3VIN5_9BURK|nr:hypothetical protein D2917_17625 [Cupriavidus oxalaticus]
MRAFLLPDAFAGRHVCSPLPLAGEGPGVRAGGGLPTAFTSYNAPALTPTLSRKPGEGAHKWQIESLGRTAYFLLRLIISSVFAFRSALTFCTDSRCDSVFR